jgi:YggT family protein
VSYPVDTAPALGYSSRNLFQPERAMLFAIIQIIGYLISILTTIIIVQFILSLLLVFNVISLSNNIVSAIWQSLNMILDPVLKPIRRIMPDTGMIDFSPIVLIVALNIIQMLLIGLQNDMYRAGM